MRYRIQGMPCPCGTEVTIPPRCDRLATVCTDRAVDATPFDGERAPAECPCAPLCPEPVWWMRASFWVVRGAGPIVPVAGGGARRRGAGVRRERPGGIDGGKRCLAGRRYRKNSTLRYGSSRPGCADWWTAVD